MTKSTLITLFLAILFNGLMWWSATPLWQTPDEQAHFAQLSYSNEIKQPNILGVLLLKNYYGKNPLNIEAKNLSREIFESERALGTNRDDLGNNKYTYHPEFNIEYTNSTIGARENEINTLNYSFRNEMVGEEAALYPPVYYYLVSPIYISAKNLGIIDRVFVVRLFSILLHLVLVYVAYKICQLISDNKLFNLVVTASVGLHPMMRFVSVGVHPDNLFNLIYSLGIYVVLLILKNGLTTKRLICGVTLIYFGLLTKVLMVWFIPIFSAIVVYAFFKKNMVSLICALVIVSFPIFSIVLRVPFPFIPQYNPKSLMSDWSLLEYLKFRIPRTIFETLPWFWGVYKWLGVVMPLVILKILTRVVILSTVGLVFYFVNKMRTRWVDFKFEAIILMIVSVVSYYLYLIFLDWRSFQNVGFSFGLQGRYFFANIVPIMYLLVFGLLSLIPENLNRLRYMMLYLIFFGIVILNFVGYHTLIGAYYDLNTLGAFIKQLSQYKPLLIKGYFNIAVTVLFLVSLLALVVNQFKLGHLKSK